MSKKGKHKSIDKELKPSVAWLESLDEVRKIIIGLGEPARHSYTPGVVRYQRDVPGGIRVIAYGGKGVMNLFIKVDEEQKADLVEKIGKRWAV